MYVVIMGCGRVGSALSKALAGLGHEVTVIDRDETAFRRLGEGWSGRTLVGMGFDRGVLASAEIERADAFAAVSSGDNTNIIAVRVAREAFSVPRVVARIYDAKRAAVYERLGIPTVAAVPWATDRFLQALTRDTELARWRDPSGTVAVTELALHDDWRGRTVAQLEEATGSRVAFLIRFGAGLLPNGKTVIQAEDSVFAAAVSGQVASAVALAAAPPAEAE